MSVEYMHLGIPVLNKRLGMIYDEEMRFWVTGARDNEFRIKYMKFEEGTPFPEILSKQPHVAYKVDNLDYYEKQAGETIFGPIEWEPGVRLAFVLWDDVIVELYEEK